MISLYSDGDSSTISWGIRTPEQTLLQWRVQAGIYHNVISHMQARFVALHVGLFWGIGVFTIQNGDHVQFMIDDPTIVLNLERRSSGDAFVDGRMRSIDQLIRQRDLKVSVYEIDPTQNIASPLLQRT